MSGALNTIGSGIVLGQISEGEITKRFSFLLQDFGLNNVRPLLFKSGTNLKVKQDAVTITAKPFEDLEYNMTTDGKPVLSYLGTPIFCDVILETSQKGGPQLKLTDVMVLVNMQKNIVKTTVKGRSGTVKEYIADGDFDIRLMGRLTQPFSRAYPKDQMIDMISLVRASESLKVTSELLQMFGIFEIVVERYSFPQKEGFQNIQLFDLQCCSDEPIQLQRRVQ